MPCSTCLSKSGPVNNPNPLSAKAYRVQSNPEPCDYSIQQVTDFNSKLVWFKNKALYRKYNILPKTINSYIGIVLSALNTKNLCVYSKELGIISDLVDLITTLQNSDNV